MTVDQLRARFLDFFKKRGHAIVSSDSLIPEHDPTLLFTGAGMNQFKDQFMGRNIVFNKAVTCQKCLRTADLEKVGKTAGHHTFFEMLGNFSFGDYFKKETILWAWEFLTKELSIPHGHLWASVYEEDDEAYGIWKNEIKLPSERIVKFGDKDNFWPSEVKKYGPNGPCGPCSEIFYDWGKDTGCKNSECSPSCDCGRFVEIWNLVFTQFERKDTGTLKPLPKKNIDTGMGLERLAAVTQKKKTNFGIDTFNYIIKSAAKEIGIRYGRDQEVDKHLNAICDHIRAVVFAIGDGVRPSNESRGFVIRKLIRKASNRARSIGVEKPFLYNIVPAVARAMKAAYPELSKRKEDIASVILREEASLKEVLDTILPLVEEEFLKLKKSRALNVPGEVIFKYYDEKGIPLDLIEEKAQLNKLSLDMEGFKRLLENQRARSRGKSKVAESIFVEKLSDIDLRTNFLYGQAEVKAKVQAILKEENGSTERVEKVNAGDIVHIAFDKTTFYGESGGQTGDCGEALGRDLLVKIHTAKKYGDTIDHIGRIEKGSLGIGDEVELKIDKTRREKTKKNHTATHLLHSALRKVLGGHVRQYGSLVDENRLRFDFTHPAKLEAREIGEIEGMVNDFIGKDINIDTKVMSLDEARKIGAMALFGEKYKENVMVRTIGNASMELCGGTHVKKTGQIGVFKILSESSIASGVRRIEAMTGSAVYSWLKADIDKIALEYKGLLTKVKESIAEEKDILIRIEEYLRPALFKMEKIAKKRIDEFKKDDLNTWLKEIKPEFMRTIEDLSKELKKSRKKSSDKKMNELKGNIDDFIKGSKNVKGIRVIAREVKGADMGVLRPLVDNIKNKAGSVVIVLASRDSLKANLICGITKDLVKQGIDASKIIKKIAVIIGGSGGGRPDMAQAGGRDPGRVEEALAEVFKVIEEGI